MMYLYHRLRYENIKFTSFEKLPIANKDYDSWVAVFNAKIQNTFFYHGQETIQNLQKIIFLDLHKMPNKGSLFFLK